MKGGEREEGREGRREKEKGGKKEMGRGGRKKARRVQGGWKEEREGRER